MKLCTIKECSGKRAGYGYCGKHYQRFKKYGDPFKTTKREKGAGWYTSDGYIKVEIKGKSYLQHRMVWEKFNGPIPKGYDIHHKNHVRDDNRLENLEMLSKSEHSTRHKTGTKHSLESRFKMSKSALGRKHSLETRNKMSVSRTKPVQTCLVHECEKRNHAKGYCANHYYYFKNGKL